MKKIFAYSGLLLLAGIYSSEVMAACPAITGPNPLYSNPASPQSYDSARDGKPYGELVGSGFSGEVVAQAYFKGCNGAKITSAKLIPFEIPTTIKYNDGSTDYDIYATGSTSIGYAIAVRDSHSTQYKSMSPPSVQTYPAEGTPAPSDEVGFAIKAVFATHGYVPPGSYTIPAHKIGQLSATQEDGQTNQADVYIGSVVINVTSTGCNVTSSNNATINLGDIMPSSFTGVGSLAGSGSTTLSLQCDAGIQLWASMADSSNPANTTDTLSLTPDSVAQGVGIQFFANNLTTPVKFGPDSSSKGLPNAFFIDNSTGDGSVIEFPIVAKYIQTGRLAPGSAKGIATVTFSYQ